VCWLDDGCAAAGTPGISGAAVAEPAGSADEPDGSAETPGIAVPDPVVLRVPPAAAGCAAAAPRPCAPELAGAGDFCAGDFCAGECWAPVGCGSAPAAAGSDVPGIAAAPGCCADPELLPADFVPDAGVAEPAPDAGAAEPDAGVGAPMPGMLADVPPPPAGAAELEVVPLAGLPPLAD
jgi:hypothetical protein